MWMAVELALLLERAMERAWVMRRALAFVVQLERAKE